MRLAFLTHGLPFTGRSLEAEALGGSETALIQVAEALSGLGHEVDVFAHCPQPDRYKGVAYHDISAWPKPARVQPFDVVVVSRFHELLDGEWTVGLKALWLHDIVDRPEALASRMERIGLIFCLSDFHCQDTLRRLPAAAGRVVKTRNGLDLDLIQAAQNQAWPRNQNMAVYASRPERGLKELLTYIWPALRNARPDMELHVCGYPVEEKGWPEGLIAEYRLIRRLLEETQGVVLRGGLNKPDFYSLLAEAGFLLYPCTFAETSCLVALEAQALDTPIVTSDRYALSETVMEPGFRVPGQPGSADYLDSFVDQTLDLARSYETTLELAERAGREVRARYDWNLIAKEWTEHFMERLYLGTPLASQDSGPVQAPGPEPSGRSFAKVNQAVLADKHPEAAASLDAPQNGAEVTLSADQKGRPLLKAREQGQPWTALHSAVDPLAEAKNAAASLDLAGVGLVVALGFGSGLHLEALAARLAPGSRLVVIEPAPAVLTGALKARDLSPLLNRPELEIIIEADPALALNKVGRLQIENGFPKLRVFIHQPSLRAMPRAYGLMAESLRRLEKVRIGDKLVYPKFGQDRVRVLVLHGKYFLTVELKNTITALDHEMRLVLNRDEELGSQEVIRDLVTQILDFRPDFILTINHLGFDREGVLTDFLSQIKMPFASWYVDSPLLIIRHYQENRSPWGVIFLWDKDYLTELAALGYENLYFLPLAADEKTFRPFAKSEMPGWGSFDIAFVGNSMRDAIAKQYRRLNLPPEAAPLVDRAAELFAASPERYATGFIKEAGLLDHPAVAGLAPEDLTDLEALVVWRATQLYRLKNLEALGGLGLTVVGDGGWQEQLDRERFQLHPPINYYEHLAGFYNSTAINFNATSLQMKTGLNQRVFDAPACGRFLLTDHRAQAEELFEPGQELVAYRSPEEAKDLAAYYLSHPDEREQIAQAAFRRVMAEHTYRHRLTKMIEIMKKTYQGLE